METDFIELMQAFQKTGVRLNKLNESIVGFKDILNNLQTEMDQLIEMVELENIIALAQTTTEILKDIQIQYDNMNGTYEQLLISEDIRSENTKQLIQLKALMNREFSNINQEISNQFEVLSAKMNSLKATHAMEEGISSKNTMMTKCYTYSKDDIKQQLIIYSNDSDEETVIESFNVGKFQKYEQQLFVQNEINQSLYLCEDKVITLIQEGVSSKFHILGFEMYDLVHNTLQKTNMMTHKKTILFENIIDFEIQGQMLWLKESVGFRIINLNE